MTHSQPQGFLAVPHRQGPRCIGPACLVGVERHNLGLGATTSATQVRPISVTLPRRMSLSRNPTSTTWRNP
jgi:hypothetical protein